LKQPTQELPAMSDVGRELADMRREIVEARNQAIKTDNQVKNLTLDIKGFEKRFDGLEGRVRLSSIGVNLIVAVTIAVAAYLISSVRLKTYETEIVSLRSAVQSERETALSKTEELRARVAEADRKKRQQEQASDAALRVVTLLDSKQDKEAGLLLDKLDMAQLTGFERKMGEKRFEELRRRQGETAYRAGRTAAQSARWDTAVSELTRALSLDPDGRNANATRAILATGLYALKKYDEAEPLLRAVLKSNDKAFEEESRYYLAATLARLGRRDEAKRHFSKLAISSVRFGGASKSYLTALAANGELPIDAASGRLKTPPPMAPPASAAAAPTPAAATAPAQQQAQASPPPATAAPSAAQSSDNPSSSATAEETATNP
jgi:tetratricopeptide (TPR) repeat protein